VEDNLSHAIRNTFVDLAIVLKVSHLVQLVNRL
jgi:hypothetical protein